VSSVPAPSVTDCKIGKLECGNGVRCFARFVHERGLTRKKLIRVSTKSGIVEPEINEQGWVRVNMGAPKFRPAEIPFIAPADAAVYQVEVGTGEVLLDVVNMGNPHAVIVVDDILKAPVETLGPLLENTHAFLNV